MMPRALYTATLAALLALPPAMGQMVNNPARRGEFPGLSLLPAGSVVKSISLPRYENRRVTAHLMADMLEVISARRVRLTGIRSYMYREDGEETLVRTQNAVYDFDTEMMNSDSEVSVENPRFRAQGVSASFSNVRQQGLLKGPVHTLFNTEELAKGAPHQAGKQKPAAP